MKKLLATTVLSLISFGAIASDLPSRVPATAHAPVFVAAPSWTGCFLGGAVGYRATTTKFVHAEEYPNGRDTNTPEFYYENFSVNPSGFVGGGQVGCQYQTGSFVFGIEGAFIGGNHDDGQSSGAGAVNPGAPRNRISSMSDTWSLVGRLGWVWNDFLVYGKAGIASSKFGFEHYRIATGEKLSSWSDRDVGFVVGAGFEYRVTRLISVGLDYSYANYSFDRNYLPNAQGVVFQCCFDKNMKIDSHTILARVNFYPFGVSTAAPVMARY